MRKPPTRHIWNICIQTIKPNPAIAAAAAYRRSLAGEPGSPSEHGVDGTQLPWWWWCSSPRSSHLCDRLMIDFFYRFVIDFVQDSLSLDASPSVVHAHSYRLTDQMMMVVVVLSQVLTLV